MKLEIKIPQGIKVEIDAKKVKVTGPKGTVQKEIKSKVILVKLESDNITLETKNDRKATLAIINTTKTIIENMISGVKNKYVYTLNRRL